VADLYYVEATHRYRHKQVACYPHGDSGSAVEPVYSIRFHVSALTKHMHSACVWCNNLASEQSIDDCQRRRVLDYNFNIVTWMLAYKTFIQVEKSGTANRTACRTKPKSGTAFAVSAE
jgi:hypothetical protein